LLVPGAALPRYPGLRFGLPAPIRLGRHWQKQRPDAVYIATEGPLGWSALRTARRLGIPVASGFHTRFDEYLPDYGVAWLQAAAMRWMRRFHNQADATLVPTRELQQFLGEQGFERVRLLARAVDSQQFDPGRRDPALREDGAWMATAWWRSMSAALLLKRPRPGSEGIPPAAADPAQGTLRVGRRWPGPRKLAHENPDFIFCGIQRGDALARHFASGDLFLFPSRSETFGNVTLEAWPAVWPWPSTTAPRASTCAMARTAQPWTATISSSRPPCDWPPMTRSAANWAAMPHAR
jgi:glycosyltransferase involved in cell wall biosynthesis